MEPEKQLVTAITNRGVTQLRIDGVVIAGSDKDSAHAAAIRKLVGIVNDYKRACAYNVTRNAELRGKIEDMKVELRRLTNQIDLALPRIKEFTADD